MLLNNLWNRRLALFLAFALIITCFSPDVFAALSSGKKGTSKVVLLGESKDGKYFWNPHYSGVRQFKYSVTVGGDTYVGYCLTPSKDFGSGSAYTTKNYKDSPTFKKLSAAKQDLIVQTMLYGYRPGKGAPSGNGADYYAATQTLIREIIVGDVKCSAAGTWTVDHGTEYKMISGRTYAGNCYRDIRAKITADRKGPSFGASTSGSAKTYKMTYNYSTKKWSTTLSDSEKEFYYQKTASSTAGLTVARSGYSYTMSVSKAGTYTAQLANTLGSPSQSMLILEPSSSANQSIVLGGENETRHYVKVTTEAAGSVRIVKTSDTDVVQGFRFRIVGLDADNKAYSGTFTTNAQGLITASLYPGRYRVSEELTNSQKLEGYEEAPAQSITIAEGKTATVNVHNEYDPHQGLIVEKKVTGDGPVGGFAFEISGVHFNNKTITADQVKTLVNPTAAIEGYSVGAGAWELDTGDVAALNAAAKAGKTGTYPVKLTATASLIETPTETTEATEATAETDAEGNTVETEPTQATEPPETKPATLPLSIEASVNLVDVNTAASAAQSQTLDGITYNNVSWAGAATLFSATRTTNTYGKIEIQDCGFGTFTVKEVLTDAQHKRYHQPVQKTIELTEATPNGVAYFEFENVEREGDLTVKKTSADDNISEIKFRIEGTTAWGTEIEPMEVMTNEEGVIDLPGMEAGTYTINEIDIDLEQYKPVEPQEITITGDETEPIEVAFKNVPLTDVEISKVSETTGEELPGATLQILDQDGNVVEEWVSGTEPHVVKGLDWGETYTLRETIAPLGYAIAQDITFVAGDEDAAKIVMVDEAAVAYITKVCAVTGKYLPGATYDILSPDKSEVLTTITTPSSEADDGTIVHEQLDGLVIGETYWAREVKAPEGYTLAKKDVRIDFDKNKAEIVATDVPHGKVEVSTNEGDKWKDKYDGSQPQTGDYVAWWLYVVLMLTAAGVAAWAFKRRECGDSGEAWRKEN